jgi:hypothetical protein
VKIERLVAANDQASLDLLNQYNVRSAWFDVDYGGCKFGIFSAACPVEPLHSLENGIIEKCLQVLVREQLSPSQCTTLDGLARAFTLLPRQAGFSSSSDKSMPRALWKDGITNLANLKASHKVGIMFTIILLSLSPDGSDFFKESLGVERAQFMLSVFQTLLAYWMWLKRETFWKRGDKRAKEAARDAIREMIRKLIDMWPRGSGQHWILCKIHEQLHVPDDIERQGSPLTTHTGPTEHNHIQGFKKKAINTQKRRATMDWQVGNRVAESYIIDTALAKMQTAQGILNPASLPPLNLTNGSGISHHSSKAIVYCHITPTGNHTPPFCTVEWLTKSHPGYAILPSTLEYIAIFHAAKAPEPCVTSTGVRAHIGIHFFTEYQRNGHIFRAHSDYRSDGAWYDWVMIKWARDMENTSNRFTGRGHDNNHVHYEDQEYEEDAADYAPGRICGFIQEPGSDLIKAII